MKINFTKKVTENSNAVLLLNQQLKGDPWSFTWVSNRWLKGYRFVLRTADVVSDKLCSSVRHLDERDVAGHRPTNRKGRTKVTWPQIQHVESNQRWKQTAPLLVSPAGLLHSAAMKVAAIVAVALLALAQGKHRLTQRRVLQISFLIQHFPPLYF